ncbi:patched domain-containing protein 3-like [Clupea harengus]|uniref:Patched domain-containing protein 3-like n=1 Tax=Clupea harengus TaxID=7950 RepID=A0A6P8GZR2_CLUHA|nr:patched domain-containing protein 3-like [Clupea harengus]
MPSCNTNCIVKPLSEGFHKLGLFVGKHPWVFLVLPFILSGGLGGGFYFLSEREAGDIEDQFTPVNGPAKKERENVKTYFPHSDEFSQLRLYTEGTYASLIVFSSPNNDLLSNNLFRKVIDLDHKVLNITTELRESTYADLCAKKNGTCASNAVLDIVSQADNTSIEYPFHHGVFLGSTIGGVTLKPNSKAIQSAEAVRLFYFLKDAKTEMNRSENGAWLQAFIKTFSEENQDNQISVSLFTSISREEEFDKNSETVIPLFSITYALVINIAVFSCLR